jgi:hypothetical protein
MAGNLTTRSSFTLYTNAGVGMLNTSVTAEFTPQDIVALIMESNLLYPAFAFEDLAFLVYRLSTPRPDNTEIAANITLNSTYTIQPILAGGFVAPTMQIPNPVVEHRGWQVSGHDLDRAEHPSVHDLWLLE